MVMHWQQWYFVFVVCSSLAMGVLRPQPVERVVAIFFSIFGTYVLYSGGFFTGMVTQ